MGWRHLKCGVSRGGGEPLVYALKNPQPDREIAALVRRGSTASALMVAGITCYCGSDHPLRHLARRMYRISRAGGKVAEVEDVLDRPRLRKRVEPGLAQLYMSTVRRIAEVVADPTPIEAATRDADDDYLVALGREHGVDWIVTGDKDLL